MEGQVLDAAPQGEPGKLQKLVLRFARVVYPPLPQGVRRVGNVGSPNFQHLRYKRDDAIVEALCGAGLLVENRNLQILVVL
jgi:hypothetical protein